MGTEKGLEAVNSQDFFLKEKSLLPGTAAVL